MACLFYFFATLVTIIGASTDKFAEVPTDELQLLQIKHDLNARAAGKQGRDGVKSASDLACPVQMAIPSFEGEEVVSLLSERGERSNDESNGTASLTPGALVKECELPWMAFIYGRKSATKKMQDVCSGALISDQHLLTAAHCFYLGDPGKPFDWPSVLTGWVKVNVLNPRPGQIAQTHFIESVSLPYADSWYETTYGKSGGLARGDIALVKLKKAIPQSRCVSSICLPEKSYISKGAGWNVAGYGAEPYALRHGRFEVSDPRSWSKLGGESLGELSMFAARGRRWKDAGNFTGKFPKINLGDSGGPFMVQDGDRIFIAGTVMGFALSWSSLSWQAVYTDVFKYRKWISRAARNPKKSPGGSAASSD